MSLKMLTIGEAGRILGVSLQTLRRWDDSGKLLPVSRKKTGHRHYLRSDVENYIRDSQKSLSLFKMARNWLLVKKPFDCFSDFYCQNISVFQARLTRLETELGKTEKVNKIYPLISAITGEIGNNSFDHNLGNWPDIMGIFFAYNLDRGKIVLADRGQGILATLRKARPELKNHQEALRVAFTEIVSGRAPEYRGNGLKFVRDVVFANKISLFFQTGDAWIKIKKNDLEINVKKAVTNLRGCLVEISF